MKGMLGSSRGRPALKGRQAGMPAGGWSQDQVWRQGQPPSGGPLGRPR